LTILAMAIPCFADVVNIAWDHTGGASGFILYAEHTDGTQYTKKIDATARSLSFEDIGLPVGTYDLWMTAYNAKIESAKSNVIQVTVEGFTPPEDTFPAEVTLMPVQIQE
jgi:hypothetical protein